MPEPVHVQVKGALISIASDPTGVFSSPGGDTMGYRKVGVIVAVCALGAAVQVGTACSSSSSGGGGSSSGGTGSSSGGKDATASSSGGASSSGSSSGSASSSGSGGGSCNPANGTYTVTITPSGSNAAACPTATELGNGNTFTWPPDTGTGLPAGCTCSGSTESCNLQNVPCGPGCIEDTALSFAFSASGYTGTITVTIVNEAGTTTCNYTATAH